MTNKWCVYKDTTDCGVVFYIGKGNIARFKDKVRNKKHTHVAAKYGITRTVLRWFDDEDRAYRYETFSIGRFGTLSDWHRWGCNFEYGGKSRTLSDASRLKMRKSSLGSNHMAKMSPEAEKERVEKIVRAHTSREHTWGRKISANYNRGAAKIQIHTPAGVFDAINAAAVHYGMARQSITHRVRSENKRWQEWYIIPKEEIKE